MKRRLLALFLMLSVFLGFCLNACAPGENPAPIPGPTPGENDDPSDPGENDDPPAEPDVTYPNGGEIADTGAILADGTFAATAHAGDPDGAEEISADALITALTDGTLMPGMSYSVTDPATLALSAGAAIDGKYACVFFPAGLTLTAEAGASLSDLLVVGAVTVSAADGLTLSSLDLQNPGGAALTVAAGCKNVRLNDCRLTGKTAAQNASNGLVAVGSVFIFTETGLADTAENNTYINNCRFEGDGTAVSSTAKNAEFRRSTYALSEDATGIHLTGNGGMTNGLIAENIFTGAQTSVLLDHNRNTSVVLNSAVSLVAKNSHSVYLCSNSLGGRLICDTVDYLLADDNTFPDDGLDHTARQTAVTNQNGDSVTDVDARAEYGANEDLLPHVDKDLFVGEPMKAVVRDPDARTAVGLDAYLTRESQYGRGRIVLAPGKYMMTTPIQISGPKSIGTDVYGYGVYGEQQYDLPQQIGVTQTSDVTVRGLLLAYRQQSCGQVYVLEKPKPGTLLVVAGAGMQNDFAMTDAIYATTTIGAEHSGDWFAYCDATIISTTKQPDNTMLIAVSGALGAMTEAGDVLTCRSLNGNHSVYTTGSSNVTYRDVTIYGSAGGFAFFEHANESPTHYLRALDTTRTGAIISESVYDRYAELQDTYGVDLEISIDEQGRFRGSPCHISSIDASHVACCKVGSQMESCLFENMCDDGTNQKSTHARMHTYSIDEQAGTVTIDYKGALSEFYYYNQYYTPDGFCTHFSVGDRVYIYASNGRLVCDAPALTAAAFVSNVTGAIDDVGKSGTAQVYRVTVPLSGFHEEVLDSHGTTTRTENHGGTVPNPDTYREHLTDNTYYHTYTLYVDNMSWASGGFNFDNCLIQRNRSRGLILQSSGGTVKHCTFRRNGMSGINATFSHYWGESGMVEGLEVSDCLFDNGGFFNAVQPTKDLEFTPLIVCGLGMTGEADTLLDRDIVVRHNKIKDRATVYAFYFQGVKNVQVLDNDIGLPTGGDDAAACSRVAWLVGALDIEFSGNRYAVIDEGYTDDFHDLIFATNTHNVHGEDIDGDEDEPLYE